MKKFTIKEMILCALFAAITGIFSQIGIPIGEIPVNMATFSVYLCAALLGGTKGALSMGVYTLLGAVGVPVFSAFRGGLGVLAGPTGGYIIGYIFAALVAGLLLGKIGKNFLLRSACMLAGMAVCYLFGTLWFMHLTARTAWEALGICVIPYLPGDALKIAAAAWLAPKLQKALARTA